jgi:hypothetical protein
MSVSYTKYLFLEGKSRILMKLSIGEVHIIMDREVPNINPPNRFSVHQEYQIL